VHLKITISHFATILLISLLLGSCSPAPVTPAATPPAMTITYVCNAGYILEVGDQKILVDALFQREDFCGVDLPRRMREASPPFDDADLVLVSHNHSDHFNAQVVGEYLAQIPGALLVGEGDAVDALAQEFDGYSGIQARVTGVRLESGQWTNLNLDGIELGIVNAPGDTHNLAMLVQAGGRSFFHSGDMAITDEIAVAFHTGGLPEAGIDIALVPFTWFLDPGGPEFLTDAIGAREFIPMHFIDSHPQEVANLFSSAFPEVSVLIEPLASITR
jgi:L-ascorbate metabolism protein UlaG (beta-lactamase superfamily)